MSIAVGDSGQEYAWIEDWAEVPGPEEASVGWAHHGLGVTRAGEIVSFHPERPEVLIFDRLGHLVRSWRTGLKDGHGITIVDEDGEEQVFVADPGSKMRRAADGSYAAETAEQGQVVKFDLWGRELMRLDPPPHPAYETGRYAPTAVAVDEARRGGSGDIFVADGYGQSLVHRFGAGGAYLSSLSGEEGGGRFSCPHSVHIDRRRGEPELWVADRGNARAQVYDLAGGFRRVVGEAFLDSPSVFAALGRNLVVGELRARLAVLGPDDELIGYLGENGQVCDSPGWPNGVDDDRHPVRMPNLRPGRFNSPHGLAADADGNLYVAEWLIGGRMIKLTPASAPETA